MHEHLRTLCLDRVACALYDESEDRLKTFLHSTRTGEALRGYEFPLHESRPCWRWRAAASCGCWITCPR
jgi:hypothetical protein